MKDQCYSRIKWSWTSKHWRWIKISPIYQGLSPSSIIQVRPIAQLALKNQGKWHSKEDLEGLYDVLAAGLPILKNKTRVEAWALKIDENCKNYDECGEKM